MPIVPKYDNFQAAPSSLPQARVTSPDMPDIAGQQAQQFGQGAMQAGQAAAQVANDIAAQANQLRIDDALNQAKEAALRLTYDKDKGFTSLKGVNALQRPDGKPLADEYGGALKDQISQIASTLGNDVQRQAFALHSNDILSALRSQATQHEAGEFRNYALSTSEGIQSTALRDIGLNWKNPDAVNSAVERIRAETYRQAQLLGKSAEWQEAQARKLTSNGHKVALLAALENNNPEYADSYLGKYSGQMDADDILAVRGHITREMDNRVGMSAAGEVMRGMLPRMQTSDAERAFNIAVGTESGGRQFGKDGKPLTSSAGAIGIAQVMPETAPEAAKLAGLPWDENRYKTDANYNRALGLAYFQHQLQATGGDLAKAYAAYNAGPERLAYAERKAERSVQIGKLDPQVKVFGWLDFMPDETKKYVAKNMREYEAGSGQSPRPTFAEVDSALRADPRLANSPARYKAAREEASRQFEEQTKAIKQREDDAFADALHTGMANGYRLSAIPPSKLWALPPQKVDELRNTLASLSKGDSVDNPVAYQKLASNPGFLRKMSDSEWFTYGTTNLSQDTFKRLTDERAKLTGVAPGGSGPGDLNSQAIKQTLDSRMRMLQIDPTPKDDGGPDAARVGAIRQFVDQYFLTAQRNAGKKFSDAEVAQHIDALFANNATFKGWFTNSSGPMLGMKVGDIDSATRSNLKAAFKRQGIDSPTDAQILNAYWTMKVTRK